MPVKVRCPDCKKVLNAPDKARGRSLKCPACEGRIKVPGDRPDGAKPRKKKRRRPQEAADPDNLLSGLDLRNAEDQRTKICPKCTKIVADEHEECPYCGVNVDTGVLSEKQQRRRSNQGPDPDDFFQDVWKNSKKFVQKNKSLVYRTVINWTITLTLAFCALYASMWCYEREIAGMVDDPDNIGVQFLANATVVTGTPDAKGVFRGKKFSRTTQLQSVYAYAHQSPVVNFWRALAVVFALGFGGWAIFLATEIVTATMRGERVLKRVQGDFFGNITLGIRAYAWPLFVLLPLTLTIYGIIGARAIVANGALSQNEQIFAGVSIASLYLLSLFFLPAAVVHWSQKHTYPAWLLVRMLVSFTKTMKASLAMTGMIIVTVLLLPLGALGGVIAALGPLKRAFSNVLLKIADAIGLGSPSLVLADAEVGGGGFFDFVVVELPLFGLTTALTCLILFGIVAFPAVYMMRALGMFGLYFRNQLDLVPETTAGEPVGFGPRFLAYCVDSLVISIVGVILGALAFVVRSIIPGLAAIFGLAQWGFMFMYYMTSETGQARATPGKWSLGIMVLTDKNDPMDRGTGSKRTLFAFLSLLTLYIGFLICLFDPEKKALHDKLSATKVCWKGDDERT